MGMSSIERAIRLLPMPAKSGAKAVRHVCDPLFVKAYRAQDNDERPIPPGAMRTRSGTGNVRTYVRGGEHTADSLETAVATTGRSFNDLPSVLDWGCGAGRVIGHLIRRHADHTNFSGSDVDSEAIDWAQAHFPQATFRVNNATPPLPFGNASFACVYSISILTHLDEELQNLWLTDIDRVLAPGGIALLSVHGEHAFSEYKSGKMVSNSRSCARRMAVHGSLDDEKFIHEPYVRSVWNNRDFPGVDDRFGLAFHSRDYIFEKWSRFFEVVDVLPAAITNWQDLAVLRKRPGAN